MLTRGNRAGRERSAPATAVDGPAISGYHLARMAYEILLAPEAAQDLRGLNARDRSTVSDALEEHLRHEPTRVSRSRIKRLRGLAQPQYRLRIGDLRVFFDVAGNEVRVLAIVAKDDAERWLAEVGKPGEEGSSLGSQG